MSDASSRSNFLPAETNVLRQLWVCGLLSRQISHSLTEKYYLRFLEVTRRQLPPVISATEATSTNSCGIFDVMLFSNVFFCLCSSSRYAAAGALLHFGVIRCAHMVDCSVTHQRLKRLRWMPADRETALHAFDVQGPKVHSSSSQMRLFARMSSASSGASCATSRGLECAASAFTSSLL